MSTIQTSILLNDRFSDPLEIMTRGLNNFVDEWDIAERRTEGGLPTEGLDNFESKLNSLGSTIATLAATLGLTRIASEAVSYASDLIEVQNVVDTSFKGSEDIVNEWAKTTLNAYGLNELSAKQFAGTMGAMLKSSGLTGDSVADMAMRITELAGDMASFYNLSGEEAFAKIRSGISGETEPLKQLGINMSVANLEAYNLSKGITKAYNSMTQAEQVALRYEYLLSVTADAQGDFSKTSGTFANQQKLLTENWKALTGELATNVLPILTAVFGFFNDALEVLSNNIDIVAPLIYGLVAVMGILAAATAVATAKQWLLNFAQAMSPISWIIMLVVALIAIFYALIGTINKVTGTTISATGIIAGTVYSLFSYLWNIVASFVNFFANIWNDPIGSIVRLFGDLADNVLGMLELIAKGIDAIFGTDLASSVKGWRESLSGMITDKFGDQAITVMDKLDAPSSFDKGYEWGEGASDSLEDAIASATEAISSYTSDIASSSASTANSLSVASEDLKYLRDLAEMETINRFTTAEVKVDLGGVTNNVASGTDLDGIIDYLTTGVQEAMMRVAEGVH